MKLWPSTWSNSATLPPRAERHGRAAWAPLGQRHHLCEVEAPRELGAVAVHLVEVGHVSGMLLQLGPRRRGMVEPRSARSVETDAREAVIALASFTTPEQTARLGGRGAAPCLAGNEISNMSSGGHHRPPRASATPSQRSGRTSASVAPSASSIGPSAAP
ncbi:hypothetical protein ACSRUE_05090 [Sorangium sp. KYC3313]|uniref:hypothetical protein n=1 Tax=Sorangium sp. KYC3313 TaxID=3449740 RepID=UPI003F8C9339